MPLPDFLPAALRLHAYPILSDTSHRCSFAPDLQQPVLVAPLHGAAVEHLQRAAQQPLVQRGLHRGSGGLAGRA